jgi:isoleucyl-tRNA synthetase
MEIKDTLNLPKTDFPMKANLSKKEVDRLKKWSEQKIYHLIREKFQECPKYILHDGPPYANGHIHIGTALNKILKDIVVKIKTMEGYNAVFIPGWDCHGLPIEHQVMQERGKIGEIFQRTR